MFSCQFKNDLELQGHHTTKTTFEKSMTLQHISLN